LDFTKTPNYTESQKGLIEGMTREEALNYLQKYTSSENISQYSDEIANLREFLSTGEAIYTPSKTITEDIMGNTLKKKERNRNPLDEPIRKQMGWELQKSTVGEYRQALSGMSRDEIVSYLSNEIGPVYLPYKQNTDAFLASGAEKYHTGGIIDSTHFTNGTDVPALLQKGETVLTKNQINDISKSLVSKDSSGGDNIFNIGSISLPDVKDSSGFIKALENISTKATKATNKRV